MKQEIKTVCASCGRTYVDVLTGATKSEGASRCPRCAPQQESGQNGNQKKSSKKK